VSITGLLFMLAFFAGCYLALARHPIYGLVTYVAEYYLHPPSRWWGESLPDLRWSLLAAGVTALAVMIRKKPLAAQAAGVPLSHHRIFIGLILFVLWVALQSLWALDMDMHMELLSLFAKYVLLLALIYKCVDSEEHLRLFLWTHVLGCVYLGWIVLDANSGGRFEGFGGPDINESNAGALQIVTGVATAGALFLAGSARTKLIIIAALPLILNAFIATVSRSGFLEIIVAGVVYNLLAPKHRRKRVGVVSVIGVIGFLIIAGPTYWGRIDSLKYAGEQVDGMDTGASRIAIVKAQWEMFKAHPMGCGHRCTAVLSPSYMPDSLLTGEGENRARSSHNTFMSLLVEQGVFGVMFYVGMLGWIVARLISLRRVFRSQESLLAEFYPAVAASLCAILIGDMFVDYLRSEARIWFVALLMVLVKLAALEQPQETPTRAWSPGRPAHSTQSRISSGGA